MFACFLTCIGSFPSRDSIKLTYKSNDDGPAFDLKVNGKDTSEKGWFVCFKNHDSSDACHYKFKNGIAEADSIIVNITHSIDPHTNYTVIDFIVTNHGEKRNISLGVFADAKIGDNDNVSINSNFNYVGSITVNDAESNDSYSIAYNSIDALITTLFIDEFNDSFSEITKYPFFDNNDIKSRLSGDNCFAFSWQYEIDHNGKTNFPIVVSPEMTIYSAPIIFLSYDEHNNAIAYNETSDITLRVIDFNINENITVELMNSTGPNITHKFTTPQLDNFTSFIHNLFSNPFKIPVTSTKDIWIYARAQDSQGLFNKINQSFIVTKRPELNVTSKNNSVYKKGGYIDISGTVYDDTKVTLFYIFDIDDSRLQEIYQEISNIYAINSLYYYWHQFFYDISKTYSVIHTDKICNNTKVPFNEPISIQNEFESGTHTLNIYALDEFDFMSLKNFSITFEYDNTKFAPELQNVHLNSDRLQAGQIALITGQVKEENYTGNLIISAEIEGLQYFNLTILQSNKSWVNFSGNVTIPSNIPAGNYKFNIQAKDDDGVNSRNQTLPFSVYFPERTPSLTVPPPSSTPASINNPIDGNNAKKSYNPIYVAVPICLIAIIVIVVALYFKFRHTEHSEEESPVELEETVIGGEDSNFVTLDNPIFTTTALHEDEDPFADDFEEGNTNKYFYTYQH